MDKQTFAELIDAYADAKASKNKILIRSMIDNHEQALIILFPNSSESEQMGGEVEITEEY